MCANIIGNDQTVTQENPGSIGDLSTISYTELNGANLTGSSLTSQINLVGATNYVVKVLEYVLNTSKASDLQKITTQQALIPYPSNGIIDLPNWDPTYLAQGSEVIRDSKGNYVGFVSIDWVLQMAEESFGLANNNKGNHYGQDEGIWAFILQKATKLPPSNSGPQLQTLSISSIAKAISDLKYFSAKEQSKLPLANQGAITTYNGNWFVNGQLVSFDDVYFAVRVNQLANIEANLARYIQDIQASNQKVKEINAWLATIRALTPSQTSDSVQITDIWTKAQNFKTLYSYNPIQAYLADAWSSTYQSFDKGTTPSGSITYQMITNYAQTLSNVATEYQSDNQVKQLKIEQLNNQRSEILDGLTSFTKGQTQVSQQINRNLG